MSDHATIKEAHPGEDVPALVPCPVCRFTQPMFILARRTTERDGVYTHQICGCQHTDAATMWAFPPNGFSTSRRALALAWNKNAEDLKK